jgi:hypothetical protein
LVQVFSVGPRASASSLDQQARWELQGSGMVRLRLNRHPRLRRACATVAQAMRNKPERRYGQRHVHFITCSCYRRRPLLGAARKRDAFLRILNEVRRRYQFWLVGYWRFLLPRKSASPASKRPVRDHLPDPRVSPIKISQVVAHLFATWNSPLRPIQELALNVNDLCTAGRFAS